MTYSVKTSDGVRIAATFYPYYFYFVICFRDVFPQFPVHPSTEFTRTDTLHSDPIYFFDGICHKTQSQTNRHPSIDRHIRYGQPLPPFILTFSSCAFTPSIREAVGPLPLLLGGVCPLLRVVARHQCPCQYTVHVGLERHPK